MALRWQTLALLAVLAAVGAVALLHHPPSAQSAESSGESATSEPTPKEDAEAYAVLKTPRTFTRATRECSGGVCFDRMPTLVPSVSRLRHWLAEAGLTVTEEAVTLAACGRVRIGHTGDFEISCVATAIHGKRYFAVQLGSLVSQRQARYYGTHERIGKLKNFGGMHIFVSYLGVPRPKWFKELREARQRHPAALQELRGLLGVPGEPLAEGRGDAERTARPK